MQSKASAEMSKLFLQRDIRYRFIFHLTTKNAKRQLSITTIAPAFNTLYRKNRNWAAHDEPPSSR